MGDSMRRIKVLMVYNYLVINGISTVIYNYCMNINIEKFDITVAVGKPIEPFYRDAFNARGGDKSM